MQELEVQADTLGQLLGALAVRIPSFGGFISGDRLHPSFIASLNGERFVSDPGTPLGRTGGRRERLGRAGRAGSRPSRLSGQSLGFDGVA